ncbi:MAG TPA: radical SAM protein [Symbiobacteriaceae bacterium]|nr:radical SAM protein [Symbiobacteriaceae bacterium]
MSDKVRPYLYYDVALALCSKCLRKVEAKILFQDGNVYMEKRCPQHGRERVLIADDIDYYKRAREVFVKPPEQPNHNQTPIRYGCPYDCGLCPDHEQHSCLSLVEVTDHCNLKCPVCYAESGPHRPGFRSLEEIDALFETIVRSETTPDVVQISGGEPTIHPQFFAILDLAKRKPIRHLMVNTNGVRIAEDRAFVERLATYMPDFELYLQFDSFERDALMELRGADLRRIREQAIAHLNEFGISTTLVVTLKKGLNDGEVGKIIRWAVQQPCVRGVTFQPVQAAGRLEHFDPARDRLTLTEVRRMIYEQAGEIFRAEDIIPVPCHPDCLAMGYALKLGGQVIPLTGMVDPQILIEGARNTIVLEEDPAIRSRLFETFATNHSPQSSASSLRELLCCLPVVNAPESLTYENVFRVLIVQFMDAYSLDVRSVKKSCIHIAHPDGRLIPFDTYNIFYRDGHQGLWEQGVSNTHGCQPALIQLEEGE